MPNLAPYHEIPSNLQDNPKYYSLPRNVFGVLEGRTGVFMVYSFLCSQYNFLTKYSFVTVHQIQQKCGIRNERTIVNALKFLKEQQLIEVREIEGLKRNCYQIYFIE